MDAISARYLVSALIQATAIIYGIVMAISLPIRSAFDDLKDLTGTAVTKKRKTIRHFRAWLVAITVSTFLTILAGINTLMVFNESEIGSSEWATTNSGTWLIVVVVFSVLTFFSLTLFTLNWVVGKSEE